MLLAATFKDNLIECTFNKMGYAHLPAIFSPDEIAELLRLYRKFHTYVKPGQSQWNSLYDEGIDKGLEISREIKRIIEPVFARIFDNWKFPVGTFMSKNPTQNSVCDVHRDFTTFDETSFQYRNIWIPLIDINAENGALYVVPQSHILFNEIRPMFSEWPYQHLTDALKKYFKVFYPKAGDLVVYADKTLHGSQENQTSETRPVVHGGILHTDATLHYYQLNAASKELKVYEVPFEFYFANEFDSPSLKEKYVLKDTSIYNPTQIGVEDVHRFYEGKKL